MLPPKNLKHVINVAIVYHVLGLVCGHPKRRICTVPDAVHGAIHANHVSHIVHLAPERRRSIRGLLEKKINPQLLEWNPELMMDGIFIERATQRVPRVILHLLKSWHC